jgi:predicted nucleic acid-binding Zn ribbon protein
VTSEHPSPDSRSTGAERARQALAEARAAARERGAAPSDSPRRGSRARSGGRRGAPQAFDAAIRGWLIDHGWQDQVAIGGVFGRWEQIVGEHLASHVRPEGVQDGELTVSVDSPAWAVQVRALAPELLRKLNRELGDGAIRSVKVRGPAVHRGGRGR